MNTATVKLLRAACDIVGGEEALAERLAISTKLLSRFLSGNQALPDALLLRAVDIILADRLATPAAKGNGASEGLPP